MTRQRELRTMYSGAALDLSDRFQIQIAGRQVGPRDYIAQMTAPDGPSTGGGVQALQHIRLMPRAAGATPILVGTCNAKENVAELRSYDLVQEQHRVRFKQPLPVERADYDAFLKAAVDFFGDAKMTTKVLTQAPASLSPPSMSPQPAAGGGSSKAAGIVLLVVAVLALGGMVAWYFMHRR